LIEIDAKLLNINISWLVSHVHLAYLQRVAALQEGKGSVPTRDRTRLPHTKHYTNEHYDRPMVSNGHPYVWSRRCPEAAEARNETVILLRKKCIFKNNNLSIMLTATDQKQQKS